MGLVAVVLLLVSLYICSAEEPIVSPIHGQDQLTKFVNDPNVRVVYFFKKDRKVFRKFLQEFEKSAGLIKKYGVEFGVVNCITEEIADYCNRADIHMKLLAFREGQELLELNLSNMFDVNSIMSNVMQIVLLREVPILQSREERLDFEKKYHGKSDIVFSYQQAIGTYDHRILMEVAFNFMHRYKFAITTEHEPVQDLPEYASDEVSAVWLLKCHLVEVDEPCYHMKYQDSVYGMNLAALTRFIKYQDDKHMLMVTSEKNNPFHVLRLTTAYLYYEPSGQQSAVEMADTLHTMFQGSLAIILVDSSLEVAAYHGHYPAMQLPQLGLLPKNALEDIVFLESQLSLESAVQFIIDVLHTYGHNDFSDEENEEKYGEVNQILEVEKQDDPVAATATMLEENEPLEFSKVTVLKDTTFIPETTSRDLLMVVFYLPFDPVSQVFLRSYTYAAEALTEEGIHALAVINCFDWTDVCGKHNITGYPTIRVYRKDHDFVTYQGMLEEKAVKDTIKVFLADSPVHVTNKDDVVPFVEGHFPRELEDHSDVAVFGLFSSEHQQELQSFKDAAASFLGRFVFGYNTDETYKFSLSDEEVPKPAVILHKRHDVMEPYSVLPAHTDTKELVEAVSAAALPAFPELTVYNFGSLYAKKQPFAILFDTDIRIGKGGHKILMKVIRSNECKDFTFVWMDLTKKDSIASQVLWEYDQKADIPTIVVVNHTEGQVYNYPPGDMSTENVKSWLHAVRDGKKEPSKVLPQGDWKPRNPGYDFLKMMDDEEAKKELWNEQKNAQGFIRRRGVGMSAQVIKGQNMPKQEMDKTPVEGHQHTEL